MTYDSALAALADPTRRAVLELLRHGPLTVGAIAEEVPVTRAAVSQHLKVLREAGLVSERPEGTKRIYRAEPSGLEELRRYLEGFWRDALKSYGTAASKQSRKKKPVKGRTR